MAAFPSAAAGTQIVYPNFNDEHAYALEISGDSMMPLYRDGDVIVVSPQAATRRGDRVVVKTRAGEVLAKELKRKSAKSIELKSLNPEHPDRTFDLKDVDWVARHYVVEPVITTHPSTAATARAPTVDQAQRPDQVARALAEIRVGHAVQHEAPGCGAAGGDDGKSDEEPPRSDLPEALHQVRRNRETALACENSCVIAFVATTTCLFNGLAWKNMSSKLPAAPTAICSAMMRKPQT